MSSSEEVKTLNSEDVVIEASGNNFFTNSSVNLYSSDGKLNVSSENAKSSGDAKQVAVSDKDWAQLPSDIVENIYSFLSTEDTNAMSSVCSLWKDVYLAYKWRRTEFYLDEYDDYHPGIGNRPDVEVAKKFGSMYKHIKIINPIYRVVGKIYWSHFKSFLQCLENSSQLISIKFINLGSYFARLDSFAHDDLFGTMTSFFESQKSLDTVEFKCSRFNKIEALEILSAVFHSGSIRHLVLRGFVNKSLPTVESETHAENLTQVSIGISNLQFLDIDYSPTFEDIIEHLHEIFSSGVYQLYRPKPGILTIRILCNDKRLGQLRGIPSETWKYLTDVFPGMKVEMCVVVRPQRFCTLMEKCLVREMPLRELTILHVNRPTSCFIDIKDLFRHLQLCQFQNNLEDFVINWRTAIHDSLVESVIPFVKTCKKLQRFDIGVMCKVTSQEREVFKSLTRDQSTLKSVSIWSYYGNGDEEDESYSDDEDGDDNYDEGDYDDEDGDDNYDEGDYDEESEDDINDEDKDGDEGEDDIKDEDKDGDEGEDDIEDEDNDGDEGEDDIEDEGEDDIEDEDKGGDEDEDDIEDKDGDEGEDENAGRPGGWLRNWLWN